MKHQQCLTRAEQTSGAKQASTRKEERRSNQANTGKDLTSAVLTNQHRCDDQIVLTDRQVQIIEVQVNASLQNAVTDAAFVRCDQLSLKRRIVDAQQLDGISRRAEVLVNVFSAVPLA